jgi:hypothetical protein
MDEQSTPEEAAELAFDEAGQADPVGARGSGGEEGLQVLPDDPVQDRVGGGARDVGSHGAGPSGFRAARQGLAAARQNQVAPGTEAARCNTRRNRAFHRRSSVGSPPPLGAYARGRFDDEVRGELVVLGVRVAEGDHPPSAGSACISAAMPVGAEP